MKIIRFVSQSSEVCWGRLSDENHAHRMRGDLFGSHEFSTDKEPIGRLVAPVEPPNIFAIGRNYVDHAREMKAEALPAEPLVFLKATTSVIGPDDAIVLPNPAPDEVDFEGELAIVIGRRAKNVGEDRALDHVLGYTCANDVTARDCQKRRDKQWTRGKGFDTFCPVGPAIVTADSLSPSSLRIRTTLNDQVMQDGNTADLIFSVPFLVSYLSHQFTLLPGTLVLTGTPAGVGFGRSPKIFLRPEDEISVEIPEIGRLANRVSAEPSP